MHDENYKKIFAFPRVIEDLLRAFVPGDWLQEVSFATLDKLSTEYISDELLKRHGDNVWRMRLRKNWLYPQPITARGGAGGGDAGGVAAGPAGAAGVRGLDAADRGAAGAERRRVAADTEVGGREYDVGGTSGRVVQGVAEGRP